jgi:hypothetical protein
MKPYSEAQVDWDYTKNEKEVDEPQQWCVMLYINTSHNSDVSYCISTHHTTLMSHTVYQHITQQGKLQYVSSDTIVYGLKWMSNLVWGILQMSYIVRQRAVK